EGLKHNFDTVKNVVASTAEAKKILREFQPDAVIGTGGYVCYPVLKAAHSLKIPTVVHESNAVPGLTTKMLSGVADRILVGFEESRQYYRHAEKVIVTGTPVRGDFRNADKKAAREQLGLSPDKPLVVSVWGSLGAAFMNKTMVGFIEKALGNPFFGLIHSAGKGGYTAMLDDMKKEGIKDATARGMEVREYIYDMPLVMAAADLVVCRVLERAGAAVLIPETDITADRLLGAVSLLLSRPETLDSMAEQMKHIGMSDATERIADIVLELVHQK
ncbi:MAG: glycosyltransferase, partial [Oscillospiraceae bacterium]